MNHAVLELVRVVAVIALVCIAAALATPVGKLPLALRGLSRIMRRDLGRPAASQSDGNVPVGKRLLAFALVLVAIILAIVPQKIH